MHFLRFACLAALAAATACTGSQTASEIGSPAVSRAETIMPLGTLNAPALLGSTIDQVRRSLGAPREAKAQKVGLEPTPEQLKATKGEAWVNTFEKSGTTIIVTFDARSRKVRDLVLMGEDEDKLLYLGNLDLDAPEYQVLPVANPKNDRQLMGLRVVPKK
ncbi:hypothetical protein [Hymenobacter weizhouensis]|uniref:hypothetical protein n=1 Tax=Hymenobacter sp. YIM 151500-1 TaxID=2987689 RepID=UPI0022266292|nr:hypothetical protein [Hymenobacter sp. YIM 151500-1]UYZ63582.1 hypothetical protein OIS53_01765 [Hymenobacter sp. YIM 151500-1]